jgi:hypothetical protein
MNYINRWIEQIEVSAKAVQSDIYECDKLFIHSSNILGAVMKIKKSLQEANS